MLKINKKQSSAQSVRDCVQEAIKCLLETKHLYQSIKPVIPDELLSEWESFQNINWIITDPYFQLDPGTAAILRQHILGTPPQIKIYCTKCDRLEPYNLIKSTDFLISGNRGINTAMNGPRGPVQVFAISYLCQSCKLIPEVFLIRREGPKLTFSGRSPIEHIDVPSCIPRVISKYYSDAILAYQSGQTLAANFLFRVLIEQYTYSLFDKSPTADHAIDQYMASLPPDFNSRFPSFRDIYGALSSDIHNAKGAPELFTETMGKIIEHFKARELFKLK